MNESNGDGLPEHVKQVTIYAGKSPFLIQIDNGLTIQVESEQTTKIFFQKGDHSVMTIKESDTSHIAPRNAYSSTSFIWVACGLLLTGAIFWKLRPND